MWAPPCWVSWWTSHRTSVPLQRPAPGLASHWPTRSATPWTCPHWAVARYRKRSIPGKITGPCHRFFIESSWGLSVGICWDILSCPKARTRLFDNNFQNFLHISSSLFLLMIIYPELTGFCLRWFVIFPIGNPPFRESIMIFLFFGDPLSKSKLMDNIAPSISD